MSGPARRPRSASVGVLATVLLGCAIAAFAAPLGTAQTSPALSTRALGEGEPALTPTDLAQTLAGEGVTVSDVTYTGPTAAQDPPAEAAGAGATVRPAAGTFTGGDGIIGFNEGVVLSSGNVADIVGPNDEDGVTTGHGAPGDSDLNELVGDDSTNDASVLEFNLVPSASTLTFRYVFASDEYNEFVSEGVAEGVNDVFGFFVNGQNCALVPGTTNPVSINTINNGNPFGNTDPEQGTVAKSPALYRNNDLDDQPEGSDGSRVPPPLDTEMDGLTTVLTCSASVTPGQPNRIKLAIADRGDDALDSNVLLEQGSFSSQPPPDSDGDGVPDASDGCPTVAAQTPSGCPPPPDPPPPRDTDSDGVPDPDDRCPTVAANTTDGCPLPAPVLGRSVNVEPVRGEVFVSLPRGASAASRLIRGPMASQVVPGLKGRVFVPLTEARQVPVLSFLDTRSGTASLASARDASGTAQSASFSGGVFQVLQSRNRRTRGLTELRLKGSSFKRCRTVGRGKRRGPGRRRARRRGDGGDRPRARRSSAEAPTAHVSGRRRIRRLRGSGSGRFRTRGRHSSATVRGTVWTVTDRCDGTLTKVARGTVAVRDFRRRKTITVRAGKSYLAKPRGARTRDRGRRGEGRRGNARDKAKRRARARRRGDR